MIYFTCSYTMIYCLTEFYLFIRLFCVAFVVLMKDEVKVAASLYLIFVKFIVSFMQLILKYLFYFCCILNNIDVALVLL